MKYKDIMRILKVNDVSEIICVTEKGTLIKKHSKGSDTPLYLLDAVQLGEEQVKELENLLK